MKFIFHSNILEILCHLTHQSAHQSLRLTHTYIHTCSPSVDTPLQRPDQSIRHHTLSPTDRTDRAPPGLPWGSLLPRASLAHLQHTHRHTPKLQKKRRCRFISVFCNRQKSLNLNARHSARLKLILRVKRLVNGACVLMFPTDEVAGIPVSFHADNHLINSMLESVFPGGETLLSVPSVFHTPPRSRSLSFFLNGTIHSHC